MTSPPEQASSPHPRGLSIPSSAPATGADTAGRGLVSPVREGRGPRVPGYDTEIHSKECPGCDVAEQDSNSAVPDPKVCLPETKGLWGWRGGSHVGIAASRTETLLSAPQTSPALPLAAEGCRCVGHISFLLAAVRPSLKPRFPLGKWLSAARPSRGGQVTQVWPISMLPPTPPTSLSNERPPRTFAEIIDKGGSLEVVGRSPPSGAPRYPQHDEG